MANYFKWHLNGKGAKTACGRGQGNSHMMEAWADFKGEEKSHQCEACAKSRTAELNKKADEKKEQAALDAWEPDAADAWMKADDALIANRQATRI